MACSVTVLWPAAGLRRDFRNLPMKQRFAARAPIPRSRENQVRRGHLLSGLAAHDWHLADAAADLGISEAQLGLRLQSAGFGYLLRQDVLDRYRKQAPTRSG